MPQVTFDPPVSERQRKAMWAAREGRSTIGIPKSVGEKFVGPGRDIELVDDDQPMAIAAPNSAPPLAKRKANDLTPEAAGGFVQWAGEEVAEHTAQDTEPPDGAGIMYVSPEGKVLFLRRSKDSHRPGEWDLPGGKADEIDDESAEETARRESEEETGFESGGELALVDRHKGDIDFATFIQNVPEFEPELSEEHDKWKWAYPDDPPEPLHPDVRKVLESCREARQLGADMLRIALDRSTVRNYDVDGYLHVAKTPISKANICPYIGHEIPGYEELGLEPEKIYKLLRHPEELAKAAKSWDGKPLLIKHEPTSADDHQTDLTIGAVGTDGEFEAPYVTNSLHIWPQHALDLIENDEQKQLSAGYHYTPDMTPGTYMGEPYDGVMREIIGNHVALVREGRAGSDVVVGDEAPRTEGIVAGGKVVYSPASDVGNLVLVRKLNRRRAMVRFA